MAGTLEKQGKKADAGELQKLVPQQAIEDLSIEANKHPKEQVKSGEPLTALKQQQIETNAKEIQKVCKNIIDHICRCRYHPEDIIIGEATLDTEHFVKPDTVILQQQGLKLIKAHEDLTAGTTNLAPPASPYPIELKYKRPIVDMLKEDIGKTATEFNAVKTILFSQDVSLQTTQQLLEQTVDLVRKSHNVLVQIDKLKAADTINWPLEEEKVERKKQEEEARKAHEEEVRPLRAEKAVIDQFDGLITGIVKLPEQFERVKKLTDPSLQELPKYIRHTKDGYEPDPLVSEDDAVWLCHPATAAGLLGVVAIRAIARKANTVKELNPERPTPDKIHSGLQELSDQIHALKGNIESFSLAPTERNPNASWTTLQKLETLRNTLPKVMPVLNELEDLPNKQGTWNLPTIRAAILRAENNDELQQVMQTCSELDNERKNLDSQINPPKPQRRNPYQSPYYPGWP